MFRSEINSRFFGWAAVFAVMLGLVACGGSSGGGSGGGSTPSYTVGGMVAGSTGSLTLQNNVGDNLVVAAPGSFTFPTAVANGGTYSVTVLTPPAGQACTVTGGSNTINGANVTNISVDCISPPSASSLTLAVGIKQLQFSWTASSGATHYQLLQNPDNASGFTQVGSNIVGTDVTLDVSVYRHNWANARYRLQACNSAGCTLSNEVGTTIGGMLAATGYFKASNPGNLNNGQGDLFGWSVALSGDGNTMAVGARDEDRNSSTINDGNQGDDVAPPSDTNPNYGAVYVFVRSGGTWAQQAYVKTSVSAHDRFGWSLALNGDGSTLAVGGVEDGNVHVFTRSGITWTKQASVSGVNSDPDHFGHVVALSSDGNTLAVGANTESSNATGVNGDATNNLATESGAAYVFTRSGTAWSQQAYIKASNTGAYDGFGGAIALSSDGHTLAVGAGGEDSAVAGVYAGSGSAAESDNSAPNLETCNGAPPVCTPNPSLHGSAGAVYVFTRSGVVWTQQAYIKASNAELAADVFGYSVALSDDGDVLAVGAPYEDNAAVGVGSNQADNSAGNAGAAYVFKRASGAWSQQTYIKASNTQANDQFGFSIALDDDGSTLAVGAWHEGSSVIGGVFLNGNQNNNCGSNPATNCFRNSGAVYVFAGSGASWNQQAHLKAPNAGSRNEFGYSVSLSSDGNSLAVGAEREKGTSAGVGGNQTNSGSIEVGAVYLY